MPYKIGFRADAHVGYAAKCRVHAASGLNERVRDGYIAHREIVSQMIEAEVDLVVDGGDTFHRSHPSVSDIVWVRRQMERFAAAGIPVIGNTGNHDASAERGKSPATAAVHDPDRGIVMLTDPYQRFEPADGLAIHLISHYGLAQSERLIPEPVDGMINIMSAHGAALVPGHEIFHCADSPGEQPIGLDLLTDTRFGLHLLGHYHGMGEIIDNVWYAGSAIRRGFSDPEGGRGWLLVTINDDNTMSVEPRYISQRAQHDLPRIDATGLSGSDVEDQIRANLASVDIGDAIVRQVVTNCSTSIRRGIDQPSIARTAGDALMWMPDFRRPELTDETGERTVEGVGASLRTAGSADLPAMYSDWVGEYVTTTNLAEDLKPVVVAEGGRHLRAASVTSETGEFAAAATTGSVVAEAVAAGVPALTPETTADGAPDALPVREPAGFDAYGLIEPPTDEEMYGPDEEFAFGEATA